MANNTILNARQSAGDTIATDEIIDGAGQSVKHQRVKVQYGDEGSATDVSKANPLPIKAGSGDLTVDAWGVQKVSSEHSLFSGLFTYDIPPERWLFYEDDAEVAYASATRATSALGVATVTSGATATNNAWIGSRRHPRYQPNKGLHWAGSIGLPDINKDGICKFGVGGDMENGMYFKTIGDGNLYACLMSDSVETHAELITFPFDIDLTKGNIYDIQAQWRGVGNIKYFAGNPATGDVELVHTINLLNTLTNSVSIANPALSLFMYSENVTEEVSLWCGCMDLGTEGGGSPYLQYGQSGVSATGKTAPIGLIAIRNPSTINGDVNTRDVTLERFTFYASKRSIVDVYTTRDAAAVTAGSWATTRTGSYVESNTTFTAVNTGLMEKLTTVRLAPNTESTKTNPDHNAIEFFIVHGDYVVFVLSSGAAVDVDVTVEWGDEI